MLALQVVGVLEGNADTGLEGLAVPVAAHAPSQIRMPPFVAVTDKRREHCARMKRRLPQERRSVLPEAEIRRVEENRGSIYRSLDAFVVRDGHVTFDGLVFDSKRVYVWEKDVSNDNFTDILLRQGLSNYLYAFTELGIFQRKPSGRVRARVRDFTGATLLSVFSSPWAQQKLKSGFLLSALQSLSSYFKGISASTCKKHDADTVVSHGCLIVVHQMFTVNFAHWMESVLPKIVRTLTDERLRDAIDQWQCSYLLYRTAFEDAHVALLGIPEERIVRYSPCHIYHARRVIVMNPLPRDHMMAEHVQAVRSRLGFVYPPVDSGGGKLKSLVFDSRMSSAGTGSDKAGAFTTRLSGKFIPSNIEEARDALQRMASAAGLAYEEYVDFHRWTLRDSIALFRRAGEFVFLEGAGALNMVHFADCVRVIEVQPEHHPYSSMGCGASAAMYLASMVRAPLVVLAVEGTTMQPVHLSVKHLWRSHGKVRALSRHGCPPLGPAGGLGARAEL